MGVKNLGDLFEESTIQIKYEKELRDFEDQKLALDAYNVLFQFLAAIRGRRGESMTDSEGRVTSHLIGALTRNCNLLQKGIIPIYVFDGESHELKAQVQQERRDRRKVAEQEYEKALEEDDLEKAQKFAQQVNRLTEPMVDDAKKLLRSMGIPVVQAPGEGEAQAAQLAKEGKVWGVASQDYDAIMFGAPRLVRNLNITGTRSKPGGGSYTIKPELINLKDVLSGLDITHEQLIDMGILLGSDFNPDGIYRVGPKTAFKYINKYGDFKTTLENEEGVREANIPYEEIRDIFLKPNVSEGLTVEDPGEFDPDAILDFLVGERGFTENNYKNLILKTQRLIKEREEQTELSDWF